MRYLPNGGMDMRIDISSRLVLLAAGSQERFGPGLPKCLYDINGETILSRLVRRFDMDRPIIVAPVWWEQDHVKEAQSLGDVITVPPGLSPGYSISMGLKHCGDVRVGLVISADIIIPNHTEIRIPRGLKWALYDPWEGITLYILGCGIDTQRHCEMYCGDDRVEYMLQAHMPIDLFRSGWINMNTRYNLARARYLCQKEESI